MCYPTTCRQCGKTTWAGCGQHVDDVQRTVPAAQWCPGHPTPEGQPTQSFFTRLFSR